MFAYEMNGGARPMMTHHNHNNNNNIFASVATANAAAGAKYALNWSDSAEEMRERERDN